MAKVKSMEPLKSTRLSLLFWLTGLSTVSEISEVAEGEPGRETVTRMMASMMGGTWPKKDLVNPISVSRGFQDGKTHHRQPMTSTSHPPSGPPMLRPRVATRLT